MYQSGWIKLHRKIQDSWIFDNPDYLRAWLIVLMEVNHKTDKVLIKKTILECQRGESLKSLQTWGILFGRWSKKKVSTFFKLLEKDGKILIKSERITTRLIVCNYSTYQDQGNTKEPSTETQRKRNGDTNKNEKNEKKLIRTKTSIFNFLKSLDYEYLHDTEFLYLFLDHCLEGKTTVSERAISQRLTQLSKFPLGWCKERIRTAIAYGWQGLIFKDDIPPLREKEKFIQGLDNYKMQGGL